MMRLSFSIIALSLASTLLISSCASRQTAATLNDVETYIQSRPDSALAVLRAIDTTTLNNRRLQAHYALLHAMALDKNWIDTTDVDVVMPAVSYYDRHRPLSRRAKPYYYLGRIQYNGGRYDEAILSFTRAGEYAEKLDDNRFKALNNISLANTYTTTSAYEEAWRALVEAEKPGRLCQDSMLLYTILFHEAQTLVNLNRHQEADSLFRELIQENNPFVQRFPQVLSSYAMFLITPPNQQYGQARGLFEQAIQKRGKLESAQYWGMYALCLANTGGIREAEEILTQLESGRQAVHVSISNSKSLIAAMKGDYKSAYLLLRENQDHLNEEMQKRLHQSTIKSQRDYYLLQKESLQNENRMRKTINLFMVLFIISAFVAATIAIRRYQEKERRHNQDLIEAVQDLMEKNNGLKLEYIHLGQENYKALSDLCNTYYRTEGRTSQANAVCGEVRGYLKTLGVGESRYPALEQRVNEQFGDIMKHFRQEHPNHREPFYQTACYLFAGFKSRTIALILNQDEQNTYKTKSLLRKEIEAKTTPHQKEFLLLLDGASR